MNIKLSIAKSSRLNNCFQNYMNFNGRSKWRKSVYSNSFYKYTERQSRLFQVTVRWWFTGEMFIFMFRWHTRELLKPISICILQSYIYCKVIITRKWTNGKLWFTCETGKGYCMSCFIFSFYAALCLDCYCLVVSVSSIFGTLHLHRSTIPPQRKQKGKKVIKKKNNKTEQQNSQLDELGLISFHLKHEI